MATEYKIIKWRGGLKADLVVGNLLPREGYICTDTGEFCFCYSAGKVKWYTSKEDIQELLDSSPEAHQALQDTIDYLQNQGAVLTGILNDINALETAKLDKLGDSKDNVVSFTEAGSDTDIASGEKHSVLFGKILKSIKTLRSGKALLDDEIATINNNLANIGTIALLATITTNTTTTVPNLSQYKYIFIQMVSVGMIVDNCNVPYMIFKLGHKYQLNTYYDSYAYGNVLYTSDTQISTSDMSAGVSFRVYGIK